MTKEFITQFNDSGKASFETFQQFNAINVATLQKLTALQFNLARLGVESTVEQAKLLTSGSDPQALFAAESALASAYGDKVMQITSETTEVLTQSRQQLAAFAEKTFAAASTADSAQVKQPKKATTKKTVRKTTKKSV